jgi:hypothetical protein
MTNTNESTAVQEAAIPTELKQQMDAAFGIAPEPPINDTTAAGADAANQGAAPSEGAPAGADTTVVPTVFDPNAFVKETFGFESLDAAKAAIQEYQNLKANPPKEELTFQDDQSKKIYQYLKEGKSKEVKQYLEAQEMLSNVDAMTPEQQLKLYIKMKNPLFDQELIDDEYSSMYQVDEDKVQNAEGEIDPLKQRKEKLRIQQKIQNDVQSAQEYFTQYKQKINLPDITPAVDEGYEAFKASTAKQVETYRNEVVPKVNSLKEEDAKMEFKVEDATNNINFGISISPSKEDFEEAKNDALDFENYLLKSAYDDKGQLLQKNLIQMILKAKNFDKYVQSVARQGVMAERLRVVETKTGSGSDTQREFGNTEKSEFQKQMDAQFAGYV